VDLGNKPRLVSEVEQHAQNNGGKKNATYKHKLEQRSTLSK